MVGRNIREVLKTALPHSYYSLPLSPLSYAIDVNIEGKNTGLSLLHTHTHQHWFSKIKSLISSKCTSQDVGNTDQEKSELVLFIYSITFSYKFTQNGNRGCAILGKWSTTWTGLHWKRFAEKRKEKVLRFKKHLRYVEFDSRKWARGVDPGRPGAESCRTVGQGLKCIEALLIRMYCYRLMVWGLVPHGSS